MNPGGEPERDDTGLPPVDIEIPDDARELDRDVQAYYRERRAVRRRQRRHRLRMTMARDGIILPLLACCLIFALITGTLLTVFTATSDQKVPGGSDHPAGAGNSRSATTQPSASASATPRASASSAASSQSQSPSARPSSVPASPARATAGLRIVQTGRGLPGGSLTVAGHSLPLPTLSRAVLLLVPPRCRCAVTLARVTGLAASVRAKAYLVGTGTSGGEVRQVAAELAARGDTTTAVATDPAGALRAAYPHTGLTLLVVAPNRSVTYSTGVQLGDNLTPVKQLLTG